MTSFRVHRVGARVAVVLPDEPLSLDQARALAADLRAACDGATPDRSIATFCELHRGQLGEDWVPATTLLGLYRRWCSRTKRVPVSRTRFFSGLQALLPYRRDRARRRYRL